LIRIADKVALMLGIQLEFGRRGIGLTDEKFIPIWERVRARGLTRYTVVRAIAVALVFGLVYGLLSWMWSGRIDGAAALAFLACFVGVALLAPIRWWQHESRFLRMTMPWVVKRFD
jgi:hypothetical protein